MVVVVKLIALLLLKIGGLTPTLIRKEVCEENSLILNNDFSLADGIGIAYRLLSLL